MNKTIQFAAFALLSLGAAACGETSGTVLERIPEPGPGAPGDPDLPPETNLRVDVFLVRDMDTCAIGNPCSRNNDPDARGDGECFELENGNGERIGFQASSVRFVAPGDEAIDAAPQAQCFRLPIDDDLADSVLENFGELRNRVYSASGREILLEIVAHDVPPMTSGFVEYENEWGIFLDSSALRSSANSLSRETDFVFAVTGARDPAGGFSPIVEHCAGTIRDIEHGLGGAPYTWLTPECDGTESLLRHWMFQVAVALRDVNDFNDLYDHDYPRCNETGRANPAEWWPSPDECSVDPDAPTCGENRCEDDEFAEHILTAHWPRGRDFVGSHCANDEQDFDETDLNAGGACALLGN